MQLILQNFVRDQQHVQISYSIKTLFRRFRTFLDVRRRPQNAGEGGDRYRYHFAESQEKGKTATTMQLMKSIQGQGENVYNTLDVHVHSSAVSCIETAFGFSRTMRKRTSLVKCYKHNKYLSWREFRLHV
jgi:hypothetical protein